MEVRRQVSWALSYGLFAAEGYVGKLEMLARLVTAEVAGRQNQMRQLMLCPQLCTNLPLLESRQIVMMIMGTGMQKCLFGRCPALIGSRLRAVAVFHVGFGEQGVQPAQASSSCGGVNTDFCQSHTLFSRLLSTHTAAAFTHRQV